MRTVIFLTLATLAVLFAVGCDQPVSSPNTSPLPTETSTNPVSPAAPDNTGVNERDASGATKTPIDQDENSADVKTTADIRSRITADSSMSINARNVKIVTSQGQVTLRGPVDTAAEKDAIDKIAREIAGADKVDNQIEVAAP
jgi:hyperosmotically inducible periplasmic protein